MPGVNHQEEMTILSAVKLFPRETMNISLGNGLLLW